MNISDMENFTAIYLDELLKYIVECFSNYDITFKNSKVSSSSFNPYMSYYNSFAAFRFNEPSDKSISKEDEKILVNFFTDCINEFIDSDDMYTNDKFTISLAPLSDETKSILIVAVDDEGESIALYFHLCWEPK